MTAEEWRAVPGFSDYDVSNLGRVRSRKGDVDRILRPGGGPRGYSNYTLFVEGQRIFTRAHELVMAAFDGDPSNNALTNLAYGTRSANAQDKRRHGTNPNLNKTHCPYGHAYDEANTYLTPVGHRLCRKCADARRRSRRNGRSARIGRGAVA